MSFRVALRKENITAIALMQQTVYANVQAYKALQHKDFSLEATQKEHVLLSEQILKACGLSPIVREFSYSYDESTWEPGSPGLSKSYRIELMGKPLTYYLHINFEKPLTGASRISVQFSENKVSEPVTVNIFDIEFVEE